MNDVKAKQQIVEKIKSSTNILVTVSSDPSVDALSAALGLTILLNKLDKHATAVFSGSIPAAITFLDPEKTFEATTDSLRDFIIALDKEKADHLRYKVEGDVVKIFITPYRTTITDKDLEFSQGDYNVELVLALGVDNQAHLDKALESHGRILHDATVATVSAGDQIGQLGSLDWHDEQASSLSEMLVSLGDALKSDKPILDKQIATALLTGIVAATDRFSNTKTSSKVMTVAAQLMAAGADQQLIATKLQESHAIDTLPVAPTTAIDTSVITENGSSMKIDQTTPPPEPSPVEPKDGEMTVSHAAGGETLEDVANQVKAQNQEEATDVAEQELAEHIEATTLPPPVIAIPDVEPQPLRGAVDWSPVAKEPTFGGTLNATTDQAEEDSRKELQDDQNKSTLTHSYLGEAAKTATPPAETSSDAMETAPPAAVQEPLMKPELVIPSPAGLTLADIDTQNRGGGTPDDALAAVHATFNDQPPAAALPFSLPLPPPLPDFSTLPPPPLPTQLYSTEPAPTERLGDIFGSPSVSSDDQPPPPTSNDPGQFKIPGQQ